jgi:zinc-ribbon domain
MIEISLLLLLILVVLMVIARRIRPRHRGLFTRLCPHCRNRIPDRAKVCEYCGRDVPSPSIWKKPQAPPDLVGAERLYRGYTYITAENGEAELKLSSGGWRKFPSTEFLKAYVDALVGKRSLR